MKANNRYSIDALHRYAHWHSGDGVMAKSLVQDAVISAAAFSRQDKAFNHHALRMVRRDLKYLDRLENASDAVYRTTPTNEKQYGALRGLLKELSFDNRDFVILHLILGYSLKDTSELLNVSRREIRQRMVETKLQLSRAYRQRMESSAHQDDEANTQMPSVDRSAAGDADTGHAASLS